MDHWKLLWKTSFSHGDASGMVKSIDFSLGVQLPNAHLELERGESGHLNLYLQVPEHPIDFIGRVIVHLNSEAPVSDTTISKTNAALGNKWILPMKKPLSYRSSQTYAIEVDIEVMFIDSKQTLEFATSESKISKDFAKLLLNKDNTDISLKVGTTELRAHKFILSARSPVLNAMLSADMLEGRTGVIELKNMSVAAAESFLAFIYRAWINKKELKETAEELLPAASMYDMPDLHAFAELALQEMITVENVGRLLLLADLHEAIRLKVHALFFLKRNKAEVTATEGWKEVIAANPGVICSAIMNVL